MQTTTDHTCASEYDEPCIACAIARGMKLRQFGIISPFLPRVPHRDQLEALEDNDDEMPTTRNVGDIKKFEDRRRRLRDVRAQNQARQQAGKHSLRMTH